jgi:regulator of cell morphogenesis and NO signaling
MTLLEQSLGTLATTIPGATALFREHRLDFCCEGRRSLTEAAAARGLDAAALASRLESLQTGASPSGDWRGAGNAKLIDHLLANYHQKHRAQLPELLRLARRVEYVHGDKAECPVGLADLLAEMQMELEGHMAKEEQILFPMLASSHGGLPEGPISVMRAEHVQHGGALAEIERLTNNIVPPVNACNTWRALYLGLAAFRDDLMQHIHLENNILFEGLAARPANAEPAPVPGGKGCGCGGGGAGGGGCH